MREDDGGKQFIDFVHKIRRQQGYAMEQVCEGICSLSTIYSMENGKWKLDKLVRDHILDRMGVGAEDYEHYLDVTEYNRWEARHRILHSITFEELEQARKLLGEYEATYDMRDKLEKQFCLGMQVQVRRWQGGSREELSAILEEAVALTVPEYSHKPLEQLALSIRELNLILEAERYRREGERAEQYRDIIAYIEKKHLDGTGRAKIYPKAVYFLGRCLLGKQSEEVTEQECKMLLEYCEHAIEILRENARMYYLWELLKLEGRLVNSLAERYVLQGQQNSANGIREWYLNKENWIWALEAVYREFKISVEMREFCYLYVEKGCYCVNDIIRIRRKMLGMSRRELCQGICDEKTLKRLEQRKTKTQWAIVEGLLERLNLPTEFTRTELITSSQEARGLMKKLRDCSNHGLWDQVIILQKRIKELVPMDIKYNQQALENAEVCCHWKKKEISDEIYYRSMVSVLELTLPYEVFLKEGEKYLTYEEQTCVQNLMLVMGNKMEECALCMQRFEEIYQPYIEKGLQEAVASIYEFVMRTIASKLGDRGEYYRSDQYSEIILEGCLRFRRLDAIKSCLYNRWWNYDKRKSEGIPDTKILDGKEELKKCIAFAEMGMDTNKVKFYQSKLKQMEDL